jgi:HAD superfamily hydrolase (TIGR01457 family)
MRDAMQSFTTYLIDLDGVIYRGDTLLPGSQDFIAWLNNNHKKYLFLTNNSFASESEVISKLQRLGITTDASHVLGAGQASIKSIARRSPGASVYLVGEAPMREMLEQHNLRSLDDEAASHERPDYVLVGLDRTFDYKKLTKAVDAIRAGAHFIAVNRDALLPVAGGHMPGCGTMVAAIEWGASVHPEVVGKPEPELFREAMRMLGSQPDETVMIGDSLAVDIKGGQAAGVHTLLVLSGNDSRASLAQSQIKPEYVYDDIAAVVREFQHA